MENKKEPRVLGGFEPKALIKTHNKKHQRKKKEKFGLSYFFSMKRVFFFPFFFLGEGNT